jgi:flagellar motor switch protein FliG
LKNTNGSKKKAITGREKVVRIEERHTQKIILTLLESIKKENKTIGQNNIKNHSHEKFKDIVKSMNLSI